MQRSVLPGDTDDVAVVAPPEQDHRDRKRAAVGEQQRDAHAELAAGDPGLRQVDDVVVDDEGEQREQQVPVAGAARIGLGQADREQQQVRAAQHQAHAPDELALEFGVRRLQ